MNNPYQRAFVEGEIAAICQCLLNEEIGIIAGSRWLARLGMELFDEYDEDLMIFLAIGSETDHLPVDWERKNWSEAALAEKDKEIKEVETFYRKDAEAACRILIARFNQS